MKKYNINELAEDVGREAAPGDGLRETLQKAFDEILKTCGSGGRVVVTNFGTFHAKWCKPRLVDPPNEHPLLDVPAQWRLRFKPSKNANRIVNEAMSGMSDELPDGLDGEIAAPGE